MLKILLPTDFSDNSWNAIKYALQLYKDEVCHFTLLNTYTPIIYEFEYIQATSPQLQILEPVKEKSNKNLDALLQRIETEFNNPNHSFAQIASFNSLSAEIAELYTGNVMDMIIMGTKGASGVKEILFGSNTVHVLKKAKCPVIAIPSDFSFETPHEILFPSDYGLDFQKKVIQPIIDIASTYQARVNILNVTHDNDLSKRQEQNRQKLEGIFKDIPHLFHSVRNQSVPEAITNFQIKAKINLLAMINNKHSFFENLFFKSNIKQIGFHLNVPLLVLQDLRN